jgi:hypothetical protein
VWLRPGLISDVNQLLQFLLDFLMPDGGDAELDQVLQLTSSTSWTAPPSLDDTTPCYYYRTSVWHGYISQAAVGIQTPKNAELVRDQWQWHRRSDRYWSGPH